MTKTKFDNVFVENGDVYRILKGKYHKICKWIDNTGYYQVVFRIDGVKKYIRVHRLIAETLLPNPHNFPQVNHIDGNKLNNDISNLEWTTNSSNTQHGYNHNLYHSKKRCHEIIAIHKITKEKFEFKSIRSCADSLKLNRKTITAILKKAKLANNYEYNFYYKEDVTTIPDECKGVEEEISTSSKQEAID